MRRKRHIHPAWKVLLPIIPLLLLLVVYLFNASRPGRGVEGCLQGCAATSDRQPGPLRVVSLNMLHGYPDFKNLSLRMDLIAAEIRRLDADVVLLQEAPWTTMTGNGARYLARRLGYNYLYYRASGNRWLIFFEEGEAILSRFVLKNPVHTVLQPRVDLFESRVVLEATAATPWGDKVFFVTHLTDKDPAKNRRQAESLRSFVEAHTTGTALVSGDFNAREDSPQIAYLAAHWTDAYRSVHPTEAGLTCCVDNLAAPPGETLEARIDYIFLVAKSGESGKIVDVQRVYDQPFAVKNGWQWASDHIGLLIEIEP